MLTALRRGDNNRNEETNGAKWMAEGVGGRWVEVGGGEVEEVDEMEAKGGRKIKIGSRWGASVRQKLLAS